MSRVLKLDNNRIVTVVSPNDVNKVITENDAEMDRRAREAVKSAINRAKICNKPIAKYDKIIELFPARNTHSSHAIRRPFAVTKWTNAREHPAEENDWMEWSP